jgi:hypothetical protein
MKSIDNRFPARAGAGLLALACALVLSACGGGGGNPGAVGGAGGGPGGTTPPTNLAFGTLTATPASIDAYGSTTLSVDVLANGVKATSQLVNVNFSSACATAGKATLAKSVPTNNGAAQTVYRDQGCGNNDVITVSLDGSTKTASVTLSIAAPQAASVQYVEATPTDKSIVIKGQGGLNRTETATLKFKVVDTFSHPLAGKRVDFTASTTDVVVNKPTDTTDENGEVITTVNSGSVPTSFRVKATLPESGISTFSDSIVVTSGLPVQRGMSLSVSKRSLEAAYDDSNAASVNILLADQFGNPVPDGTPVVFQTNLGAIGTADKGGCNTVNGGCSVPFRVQNPRSALPGLPLTPCNNPNLAGSSADSPRAGVATICASTTDGTNTLFDRTTIYFSSSFADQVYLLGNPPTLMSQTRPNDLGSVKFDQQLVINLQVNDAFLNPMPTNSTVAVTNPTNVNAVSVTPATVPNVTAKAVDDPTAAQGSIHTITLASTNTTTCTADTAATFSVLITTPQKNATIYPFKLKFTCQ